MYDNSKFRLYQITYINENVQLIVNETRAILKTI